MNRSSMAPYLILSTLALILALVGCTQPTPTPTATPPPSPTATPPPPTATPTPVPSATPVPSPTPTPTPVPLIITSEAFEANGEIPERYGFFRENLSPPLTWQNVPAEAQSLALLMVDLDFPFSHWVVYNIPADREGLPEGTIAQPELENGTRQGLNSNDELGYAGPYPPVGEEHRYAFRLYALDAVVELEPGARREDVESAMEGHILTSGELIGRYTGIQP